MTLNSLYISDLHHLFHAQWHSTALYSIRHENRRQNNMEDVHNDPLYSDKRVQICFAACETRAMDFGNQPQASLRVAMHEKTQIVGTN